MPFIPSEALIARLRKNESGQRSRMKNKNKQLIKANLLVKEAHQIALLPIEKIDIIKVAEDQDWTCACHKVPGWHGCFLRVSPTEGGSHPDAPVIGHVIAGGRGGGHIYGNVFLFRHACNAAINNAVETKDVSKTKRLRKKHLGLNPDGSAYEPKDKPRMKARKGGFGAQKRKLGPGPKMQSRNTLRRK